MTMNKRSRPMWRHLMMSVSHGAMMILQLHFAEEAQRKTQGFLTYVEHHRKHILRMTFRGKPFSPVFHAGHKIKPSNWAEAPLVQS